MMKISEPERLDAMLAPLREIMGPMEQHLKYVAVPIIQDYPVEGLDQIGTGTLLELDGKLCLLTAKHVFKDVPGDQIKIPDNPHGLGLITLWPFEVHISDDAADDVILLMLSPSVSEKARKGWRVTRIGSCGGAEGVEWFVVSGYPSALGVKKGEMVGGTLVTSYTQMLPEVPLEAKAPLDPAHDLFLGYQADGTTATGAKMSSPRLKGVSGAAIWGVEFPSEGRLWDASTALKLVGVETDAFHFNYIRGVKWQSIRDRVLPRLTA